MSSVSPKPDMSWLPDQAARDLATHALEVLDRNWMGHATRPGRLYPHQWSWDAASIAMGRSAWSQERAEAELRSLFGGQWSNGMVPQIVFSAAEEYFPGPAFWQAERSPHAPKGVRTSGIVQPPIHATAAWRVYLRAPDREAARRFLTDLFPGLAAWHGYLYRERSRGDGLAECWHPWETGMDNSPAWDACLGRIDLSPDQVPEYSRVDVNLTNPAERPTNFLYDRYAYLVSLFRELDYDGEQIRELCPFVIQPVLFNSILIQSNRDLARIARVVGADPDPFDAWADATATGFGKLWDARQSVYVDYDVNTTEHVGHWTAAAFTPLYAGVPPPEQATRLLARLRDTGVALDEAMWVIPSIPTTDPAFEPQLYWRGPVWPMIHWLVGQGVAQYGEVALSRQILDTTLELARRGQFWEHYSPTTGRGQGIEDFAWTAGLVLELLSSHHPAATEV